MNHLFLLDFWMVIFWHIGCRLRRHRYLFLGKCLVFVVDHLSFLANNREDRWNELHAFTLTSFAKASAFHLWIHRLGKVFLLDGVAYSKRLFESIAYSKCLVEFGYFNGRIDWCGNSYFLLLSGFFDHLVFLHSHIYSKSNISLRHISVHYGLKRHVLIIIAAFEMIRGCFEVRFRISFLSIHRLLVK